MNKYETVIIISDKVDDSKRIEVLERVKKYIKENGTLTKVDDIGLKKLAYQIQKCSNGYYYYIFFDAESDKIAGLERLYRITDEILKFITIRNDS